MKIKSILQAVAFFVVVGLPLWIASIWALIIDPRLTWIWIKASYFSGPILIGVFAEGVWLPFLFIAFGKYFIPDEEPQKPQKLRRKTN